MKHEACQTLATAWEGASGGRKGTWRWEEAPVFRCGRGPNDGGSEEGSRRRSAGGPSRAQETASAEAEGAAGCGSQGCGESSGRGPEFRATSVRVALNPRSRPRPLRGSP